MAESMNDGDDGDEGAKGRQGRRGEGKEAFIENKLMSVIEPWVVSSGGVAPVNIKIFSLDYAVAKELIEAFTKGE